MSEGGSLSTDSDRGEEDRMRAMEAKSVGRLSSDGEEDFDIDGDGTKKMMRVEKDRVSRWESS